MKLTHSKTASRRAHHRAGAPRLVATQSGARRRHFVDPATGMYRGRQIITVGEDQAKHSKKKVAAKDTTAEKKEEKASEEK